MAVNVQSRARRLDSDITATSSPCDAYTLRTLIRNTNHFYSEGMILVNKVWPETHPDFNLSEATDTGKRYVNHIREREMIIGGFLCNKNNYSSAAQLSISLHVANTKTVKIQCSSLGQVYDPSFPSDKALSYIGVGAYETNVDYSFNLKKGVSREKITVHIQGAEWQAISNTEYSSTAAAGCNAGNISSSSFARGLGDYDIIYVDSSSTPAWKTGSSNATIADGSIYAVIYDTNDVTLYGGLVIGNDTDNMTIAVWHKGFTRGSNLPESKYKLFQPVTTLIKNIFIKEADNSAFL